ncbi:MAG: HEAT repeat domain-containing protein, partial [Acidobacteriota bacterium]
SRREVIMARFGQLLLLSALVWSWTAGASADDRSTFPDELANLRSPNIGTRVKAAKALGRSGRKEAIEPLNEAMRDPEAKVRKAVVVALRRFKDPEAVDGLLVALRDEEKDIRNEGLAGLLELYVEPEKRGLLNRFLSLFSDGAAPPDIEPLIPVESRVVDALEERLSDEKSSLRRKAAFALGALRARDALDSLAASLADPEKKVRSEAIRALGRIGGEPAGRALLSALADESKKLRGKAVDAIGRMRYRPAAAELLAIYDAQQGKELGDKALTALALMGAPEARGVFYYNMTVSNAYRRRRAVEGLGRLDDPNLAKGLTKDFLREPDPEVQLAYCFALSRLGQSAFVDRLALSLSDAKLRGQSRDYLVELGSSLLVEFVAYLSDPVSEVRKEMAQVLMDIGDPAAIPYLEPLLSDPDREVADRVNRAIARLQRALLTASTTSPSP